MSKKKTCTSWIIRAELSNGKTYNMDVPDDIARAVDDFFTLVEKEQNWDEWIVDEV